MLKELLPTRTKQRLILAVRAAVKCEEESALLIDNEVDALSKSDVPSIELATGVVSIVGQRIMKKPVALIAGAEEFFRKR